MKGYVTASGYMGYVENEYILFASEDDYLITWRLFRDSNIPVIKRCQGEPVFEQIDLCVVNNINTVSGYGIVIDARIDPDSVSGGKGSRSRGNIIGNGSQVLGRQCPCIQKQSGPLRCLSALIVVRPSVLHCFIEYATQSSTPLENKRL